MPPANPLDVYRDWLGIEEPARPLNHYQLLRLTQFEDNTSKYPQRYRRMTGHVRKFVPPEHAEEARLVIKEIIGAMLCLSDARRKREYDRRLGRPEEGQGRPRTMEQVLLERNEINPEELTKAKNFALAVGFELRDALVQRKLAPQEAIMIAYAESVGLPYLDAQDIVPDPALLEKMPASLARKNSCVPLIVDDDQLLVLSPFPLAPRTTQELHEIYGLLVRTVLCIPSTATELLNRYFSRARPELVAAIRSGARAKTTPREGAVAVAEAPAQKPVNSVATRRTESVASALAELQAASRGENEEQLAAKAAAKEVAKVVNDSAEVQQFQSMVALAAFSLTATLFQSSYATYAFVFYHPYYFSIFLLGWVLAGIVGGVTFVITKALAR